MTEQELRNKVKNQALSWLGLCEPTTYWPIIEVWNAWARQHGGYIMTRSDPWCAAYASAVFIACGLTEIIPPEVSCGRMVAQAQKRGLWIEDDDYQPGVGDLILYDWQDSGKGDDAGEPDHVGVVVAVTGNTIYVVEGNCSDAVRQVTRTRGQQYIRGYIVPDFKSAADGKDPEPEPVSDDGTIDVTTLRYGDGMGDKQDRHDEVAAAQALLILRGCSCGWCGADGEFGNDTRKAVLKFQQKMSIPVTAQIDTATWDKLVHNK